jgi:hypothetical protein
MSKSLSMLPAPGGVYQLYMKVVWMSVRDLMLWPARRRELGRFGEDPFHSFHREVEHLLEDFFGVPDAAAVRKIEVKAA